MERIYSKALSDLADEFKLAVLHRASDYDRIRITVDEVSRPGLQLAGFFDHFEPMRLHVLGNVETTYLKKLSSEQRAIIFDHLFSYKIPALIIARGIEAFPECLEMAKKHNINVLSSPDTTSYVVSGLIMSLKAALAPRITRHGVLMEVYGEGILITGESGLGKSETAVELLKRGHRLIADDAVEIKRLGDSRLIGCAPEMIRYYMELRGIGIINVRHVYGVGAVKPQTDVDLVVRMEPWQEGKFYERLGLDEEFEEVLDVKLPLVTIPVSPGRNLAVILELAAMNNRQKKMGYNAAQVLAAEHDRAINLGGF